jgi:SulP family sulfate permease
MILRMRNARHLDATAALAIRELMRFARSKGRDIIVSGVHEDVERVFGNIGLIEELGERNFYRRLPENPNVSTRNALKRAQEILGQESADITIYAAPKQEV